MMRDDLAVAIIGAGPYGLSIAAHLNAAGVENRIFGSTMESWRSHMPPGMFLKSYADSSNLFDPEAGLTLEGFCRAKGIAYHPSDLPVSLETFVAYGRAFQERFAPRVEAKRLIGLKPSPSRHELLFDDGEKVQARRVVVATGALAFKYVPSGLFAHLPHTLASHSSEYGALDRLARQEVVVFGAGASALDIAALLAAQGAAPTVIARSDELLYQEPPGAPPALLRRLVSPPAKGLGAGWMLRLCAQGPQCIHLLPDRMRVAILNRYLGPAGGYFIRQQIEQNVVVKLGRVLERAEERHGRVRLLTLNSRGMREIIECDHLVAATGYRVDLRRLRFLDSRALHRLQMVDHVPVLNGDFESSIAGLHFVGLASARAFGPIMRFVEGAAHPARRLARLLKQAKPRVTGRLVQIVLRPTSTSHH